MVGGLKGIIGTSYGNNTLKTLHTFINYNRRSNYLQSSIIFFTITCTSKNYDNTHQQYNLQKKINFVNNIKKLNILKIKITTIFKIPFKIESIIFTEIIKNKSNILKKASNIIFKNIKQTNYSMFGEKTSYRCCGIGNFQESDAFKYY